MNTPGPQRPELEMIRGGKEVPREKETLLEYARRMVREAFNGRNEGQSSGNHLKGLPIEMAPSYRESDRASADHGSGALAPVTPLTTAEGELVTARQRRIQEARHEVEIAHSMGPAAPETDPEEPLIA